MFLTDKKEYWLYYQVSLTGTWMPCNIRFFNKKEGQAYIKLIKKGNTIYRAELNYKIDK